MTAETVRCFDALAADAQWYTFTPNERRITDEFVRRWGIRPGDWVLEPGCGSGRLTVILAALTGPEGRVLAFDASREFIRAAARRGMPAHVTLHAFRMETAPLPQASFEHGCGSGRLTVILAALTGPEGRVLAFDASREFIREASKAS